LAKEVFKICGRKKVTARKKSVTKIKNERNGTVPVVRALTIAVLRPLKSKKTSSTVARLGGVPPAAAASMCMWCRDCSVKRKDGGKGKPTNSIYKTLSKFS